MLAVVLVASGCSFIKKQANNDSQQEQTVEPDPTVTTENIVTPEATPTEEPAMEPETTQTPGTQQEETTTKETGKVSKISMVLYFPDSANEALKKESREVEVTDGAVIKAAVMALMEGPKGTGLRNPFPEGTKLLGVNLVDKMAIVDFSKEFQTAGGVADTVLRGSIVNTLTEFEAVDKVRILVEGWPLKGPNGEPIGDMERFRFDEQGKPLQG